MDGTIILRPEELDNENSLPVFQRSKSLPNFTKNKKNAENCCKVAIVDLTLNGIISDTKANNAGEVKVKIVPEDDYSSYYDNNKFSNSNNCNAKDIQIKQELASPPKPCWKRYIGIVLGLLACLTLSLSKLIVKSMTQYHPFLLVLWIWMAITIFNTPLIVFNQKRSKSSLFEPLFPLSVPEKRNTFINLILRGVLGTTAGALQFLALKYMEVADVTVIVFCAPVFVTIAAFLLLGEKCSIFTILAALLAIVGVAIIARPPFLTGEKEFEPGLIIGTSLAVASMIFTTAVFIILRFLRTVNYAIVNLSFGVCGLIEGFILCYAMSVIDYPHNAWDWLLGLSIGVLTFSGQLFFTCALKFETSSTISLVRTCDVIFSFMWQLILLLVVPDIFSLVGAAVVVLGVLIVGFIKWLDQLPEKNPTRQKLRFLLK